MPPYHTLVGNNLVVYLDLVSDTDGRLGNPIDNILAQLALQWGPIAAANGLTVTFAFSPNTPQAMNALPGGVNVIMGAALPANVEFFTFTVGGGASADQATRSARVSYVNYHKGRGYIYEMPNDPAPFVPAISHELGHVLGLSDRYYEAVYWLTNWAINRTCKQISRQIYLVPPDDFRDGVVDNAPALHDLPRLAARVSLPMAATMVADPLYDPTSNLMSTGAAALTPIQIGLISSQAVEQTYRTINWVAILGDWRRYATPPANIPSGVIGAALDFPTAANFNDLSKWGYPTWEARPQDGGQGLLFLPPGHLTPFRYGCLSAFHRGKNQNGDVIQATRLAAARGKTRVFAFGGTTYNVIGINVVRPNWMCYTRGLIADLM